MALSERREAGVLAHPTMLPDGTLGRGVDAFLEWLTRSGFRVWQTLPLVPPDAHGSPYASRAASALNTDLLDAALLVEQGFIGAHDSGTGSLVEAAWRHFRSRPQPGQRDDFHAFLEREKHWLDDFVLFEALRDAHHGTEWWRWPQEQRDRNPEAIANATRTLAEQIERLAFGQYLVTLQWERVRDLARASGLRLFGDLPLYVASNSVDVWARPDMFELDDAARPLQVAGVPPDYFSAHGQRWGNPLYDWPAHQRDGFAWWRRRLQRQQALFDILRIDHFRGLQAYWSVDAAEQTAVNGHWRAAPGDELLRTLSDSLGALELVAEDLGIVTDDVRALRDRFELPGMKVMQFAFDGSPHNPFLPANISPNSVVYSGTHDNDTTLSWAQSLDSHTRHLVCAQLELADDSNEGLLNGLLEAVLASPGCLAVLPLQDLLGLGGDARMNTPGTENGNWQWRAQQQQLDQLDATTWRERLRQAHRAD